MDDLDNTIPTLTKVAQPGNKNMLNQFDNDAKDTNTSAPFDHAHDDTDHEIPSIFIETSSNVAKIESTSNANKSQNQNTSIKTDKFSTAMQSISNQIIEDKLGENEIKDKIDSAVNNAIKDIESHLKERLYSKFGV